MKPSTLSTVDTLYNLVAAIPVNEREDAQALLREIVMKRGNASLIKFFGFRIARKKRATVRNTRRTPTWTEVAEAREMRANGVAAHLVEARFHRRGIKMTRNMQSQADGARA